MESLESEKQEQKEESPPEGSLESLESLESEKQEQKEESPPEGSLESLESLESEKQEQKEESPPEGSLESLESLESEKQEQKEESPESEDSDDEGSTNSLMMMGEEGDEDEENEQQKGGEKDKLDGMALKESNNNLFLSKLKKKEPTIFLSEDDGKFSAYSKICQASRYRQPVILNQEEKAEIDKEDEQNGSKSYNHALEYGTDPSNKNFYICPRYWCLKTNKPISEKDAKEGKKCGKILPRGAKNVTPGHYILEFNHPEQHLDKDGNYLENTPGFLEKKLHPNGLCMPCCFRKPWDSKAQVDRRKECEIRSEGAPENKKTKRKGTVKQDAYIIDIRRYPLPQTRWGFLPISVQYFLQTDNTLSVDPNTNKYLRTDKNTTTLLRFGVENSAKKSFIACIADLYAYKTSAQEVPSIRNMCEIIASVVNIDLFLKYHNGSLSSIFRPKLIELENIDIAKYESSNFMANLDQDNETHMDFIVETIAAYENFQIFLKDENSYIDHTYLWDIICSPNPGLLPNGCNLAILRIRNVDMTDDIELLCPTSVYSPVLFDIRKETFILIQHDEFFEPVYLFQSKIGSPVKIHKTFIEERSPIKDVLQIIRNSIQKYCPPKSSMPNIYKFSRALSAESLLLVLLEYKFAPLAQIINYQAKVIGIWIRYRQPHGLYIPCFPSPPLLDLPKKFMDEPELYMNYKFTVSGLNKVFEKTDGKILCRPIFKIMEDEQIIGVLTETNQFIMLSDPAEISDTGDEIPVLKDENYLIADKIIRHTTTEDPLRIQTIHKIRLETQFYSAFRTTVRILLNDPTNINYKQQIMKLVEKQSSDVSKRDQLEILIHALCDPFVTFMDFEDDVLDNLKEISDCFLNPEEKNYCILQNSRYQLIIPRIHLVSGQSNAKLYFARISDELWRYKRIQLFMLNAKTYLNLTNTEYKINPNEMLLLESLLTSDYLKSLEPYQHGNTVITYDTANPIITQKYSNEISQKTQQDMVKKDSSKLVLENQLGIECVKLTHPITGKKSTSEWISFFSKQAVELELFETVRCSYYPIIYVFKEIKNSFLTVEQIKSQLVLEYSKYGDYLDKIQQILRKQGKRDMMDDIRKGKYTLETAIMTDVYFLSTLDLWILAVTFRLPIIIFHQKKLKNLLDSINWLALTEGAALYYFVRVPTEPDSPSNYLPQYSIVKPVLESTAPNMVELFRNAKPASTISLLDYFEKIQFK